MTTSLIITTMAIAYLASMAAMTGYALKISRKLSRALSDKNEWRDHARMLGRRATRAEMLLEMADARAERMADERDDLVAELGTRRAKAS